MVAFKNIRRTFVYVKACDYAFLIENRVLVINYKRKYIACTKCFQMYCAQIK